MLEHLAGWVVMVLSEKAIQNRIDISRNFAQDLKSRLGPVLHEAFIFGSIAKGNATRYSDIDLLVVVDRPSPQLKRKLNKEFVPLKNHGFGVCNFENARLMHELRDVVENKFNVYLSCHVMYLDQFKTKKIAEDFGEPLQDLVEGRIINCLK